MMDEVNIRMEAPGDMADIRRVIEEAFRGRPYAGGDEQDVVDRLRDCAGLALSLVATVGGRLIGQAAFSPATCSHGSGSWYALGPVSVAGPWQGRGAGAGLIREGLAHLEQAGAAGCILTGDPKYYQRFGFEAAPALAPENEPAAYFMLKLLAGEPPAGRFRFHPAFYGEAS